MKWPPTDLEIIQHIYQAYYGKYAEFSKDEQNRETKIYVPIDIEFLAKQFRIDGDILFGRLYYYLDEKYGFERPDGTKVHFFALAVGNDRHVIHFPLLASVLAELKSQQRKHLFATWISIVAIGISIISVTISLLDHL